MLKPLVVDLRKDFGGLWEGKMEASCIKVYQKTMSIAKSDFLKMCDFTEARIKMFNILGVEVRSKIYLK